MREEEDMSDEELKKALDTNDFYKFKRDYQKMGLEKMNTMSKKRMAEQEEEEKFNSLIDSSNQKVKLQALIQSQGVNNKNSKKHPFSKPVNKFTQVSITFH